MPRLSQRQAIVYTIGSLILTIGISYFLPGFSVVVGGFLVGIFLTTFIDGKHSTWLAMLVSLFLTISLSTFYQKGIDTAWGISEAIFKGLLILITGTVVLYLKGLYENMRFEKTHLTSLFENATEGIILTNRMGEIVLVNPASAKMFDYEPEELKGRPIEILIPQRYRHGHVRLREGFHNAPTDREMGHGRDLKGVKKSGAEFPVEVSLSHYRKNEDSFVIAFIVDITKRKEIEKDIITQQKELEKVTNDIRKLNTELEAKVEERTTILKEALVKLEESQKELSEALDKERELNEIKSRFVSMASHEFRTPLSTVLSSASLLSKYIKEEEQEKRNKHIQRIKESVNLLNAILEDFLSLGKLDEGKTAVHPGEFDIKELINDTTEEMKGMLKPNQRLIFEYEGQEKVYSDKKLLKNILINLISNAIKFSPDDEAIEVTGKLINGTAEICVTDKGIGIPEEDQEHLFSSFFRGKNAVNIQGTGLGLHIVKRYLDLLNGNVYLHSRLNEGTKITFEIPANINNNS